MSRLTRRYSQWKRSSRNCRYGLLSVLPLNRPHSEAELPRHADVGVFPGQFPVDSRQLAGPFYDTLLEFLIQALDFSLSLFVPRGFDNVPIPASLGYGKLMGSHHIQDFGSSACRERVR